MEAAAAVVVLAEATEVAVMVAVLVVRTELVGAAVG